MSNSLIVQLDRNYTKYCAQIPISSEKISSFVGNSWERPKDVGGEIEFYIGFNKAMLVKVIHICGISIPAFFAQASDVAARTKTAWIARLKHFQQLKLVFPIKFQVTTPSLVNGCVRAPFSQVAGSRPSKRSAFHV